jgi:hypothetical protein
LVLEVLGWGVTLPDFSVIWGWLGFCLNPNEKSMFFENTMDCSLGTGEVELVFDTTGSPCGIFLFEPDNSLFQ